MFGQFAQQRFLFLPHLFGLSLIILIVFNPFSFANWITYFAVELVAPVCTIVSPGSRFTYSSSSLIAVGGLITILAAVPIGISAGIRCQWASWKTPWVLHVPWLCSIGTHRSPTRRRVTFGPTAWTTPTPSWPGVAGSSGWRGYLPSIVLISAGLIGACNVV